MYQIIMMLGISVALSSPLSDFLSYNTFCSPAILANKFKLALDPNFPPEPSKHLEDWPDWFIQGPVNAGLPPFTFRQEKSFAFGIKIY